jgi:ribosomal protein S27AE
MSNKKEDFAQGENNKILETIFLEQNEITEIRFGSLCPICGKGSFDYDGMLNLVCSNCGYTSGGCFT